jgi:hypothetical protein
MQNIKNHSIRNENHEHHTSSQSTATNRDFGGSVYSAKLDGSEKKPLLVAQGNLTGIAYAEVTTPAQVCRYGRNNWQILVAISCLD